MKEEEGYCFVGGGGEEDINRACGGCRGSLPQSAS